MQNHSLAPRNLRGALLGVVAATLFSFGGACATLPDVPAGQCGNGIVDPGEECDTFASSGARCRSEDEVFACRFDCVKTADGKQPACPAGFVCGEAEGICQRPTGQFGDAAFSFEANAGHMVLGDFDGDGRKDLVASSRPDNAALTTSRVFFFDGISSAPRGVAIPTVGYFPVAADLNGDGLSDLVLGSPQGINVFLGAADRQLDPQAYGRFPLPPGSKVAAMIVHGLAPTRDTKDAKDAPFGEAAILFAETTLGGVPVPSVAFGRGDGTFSGRPDLSPGSELTKLALAGLEGACPNILAFESPASVSSYKKLGGPLAVFPRSAVAGDPRIVRISKVAEVGGKIEVSGPTVAVKSSGDWSSALIADLNGNGLSDVVGGSDTALDLDFYNGTPSGALNPTKITTDFPVKNLVAGDVDGDLVADLVFVEIGGGDDGNDEIDVAYGSPAGAPEDPFVVGQFGTVTQLLAGRFDEVDETAEVGAVYANKVSVGDQITVLDGNGSRQLLSPFGLSNAEAARAVAGRPFSVCAGHFDATKSIELASVAGEQSIAPQFSPLRMWYVPVQSTSPQLTSAGMGALLKEVQATALGSGEVVRAAAGDLDGDGIDELVLLAPRADKASGMVLTLGKMGPLPSPPAGAPTTGFLQFAKVLPVGTLTGNQLSDLAVTDLDGDGKKDVVVYVGGAELVILWNDGVGTTDPTTAARPEPPAGKWRGFTVLDYGKTLAPVLIGVTEKGVYRLEPSAANKRVLVPSQLAGLDGGQAIVAGDVSGDGIPDLLVASGGRVSVYPGLARKP
ncbi:MAG: hypothetical protein IPJ34_43795 [Myxococcales bacterium]|nr:hypothetical protein [Myxococcales bacterium]